jgi:anti-anti-sigma factor
MPTYQLERNDRVLGNHVLDANVVTIGRARDNTIAIASSAVSRYHARIEVVADGHVLTDLGSLNGTYINGERIKRVLLSDNDRIEIGQYTIVFKEGSAAAPQPATRSASADTAIGDDTREESGEAKDTRTMHETSIIAEDTDGSGTRIEVFQQPLQSMVHQVEDDPATVVLALRGVVDDTNTKALIDIFDDIIADGPLNVVVDLSAVGTISSTGWGTLLGQQSRLAEMERGMKLAGLHEGLYQRFRTLPFSGLFACYPSISEALDALHGEVHDESDAPAGYDDQPHLDEPEQRVEPHTVLMRTLPPVHEANRPRQRTDSGPSKASMSLEDRVRCVVSERPFQSEQDIRARLRDEEYGNTDIGRFKLKALLRKLDLHTKLKRYQFFLKS